MFVAIRFGHADIVKLLLSNGKINVNTKNKISTFEFEMMFYLVFHEAPLHRAIEKDDIEMVKVLLSVKDIDVNITKI